MCYIKKTKLHISCWNINGYRIKGFNKFEDPKFIKEINTKDIIGLLETHCTPEDNFIRDFIYLDRNLKNVKKKPREEFPFMLKIRLDQELNF
jgi:exonuclease III